MHGSRCYKKESGGWRGCTWPNCQAALAATLAMKDRGEGDIKVGRVRDASEAIRNTAKKQGRSIKR